MAIHLSISESSTSVEDGWQKFEVKRSRAGVSTYVLVATYLPLNHLHCESASQAPLSVVLAPHPTIVLTSGFNQATAQKSKSGYSLAMLLNTQGVWQLASSVSGLHDSQLVTSLTAVPAGWQNGLVKS
jgi:hypothetical protein